MPNPGDPRQPIDARLDSPAREGLTGTAPANLYTPGRNREEITVAPDFRPAEEQPAWRHDFPVDWPQDLYVERRDFLKFMVLTSAAFAAGQAWIVAQNLWRKMQGQPPLRRIASVDDIPAGSALTFAYPETHDSCVLVRLGASEFVAFSQKCTHLSCAVIPRPETRTFHCPCHEGRFDLRSGAPLSGPPRRALSRVVLEVRGRDIFASRLEERTA